MDVHTEAQAASDEVPHPFSFFFTFAIIFKIKATF
jgi:hypothetical protein